MYVTVHYKDYSKHYVVLLAALGQGGQVGSNKIVLLQAQKSRSNSDRGVHLPQILKEFFNPSLKFGVDIC